MVAYNFKARFEYDVVARTKRQTIRADRKRHARPGERIQLYTGMRSRHCRKLIPDPVCTAVHDIEIDVAGVIVIQIAGIRIDGVLVDPADMEAFAAADGFQPGPGSDPSITALTQMARFWHTTHGAGLFTGKLIKWDPTR